MDSGVWSIPGDTRDLTPDVIDENGAPRIMPASYYESTTQDERSLLCVRHGLYVLPTVELVDALRVEINGRPAIEIGAGNGVIARALCIPGTDNHMQEWPEIADVYRQVDQATVRYGSDVERIDAMDAVDKYKPRVIVGCWITHRYRPDAHERGGNMYAPDEYQLLARCETLLLVGNEHTHIHHPLLRVPHLHVHANWLYSRARGGRNFLGIWTGSGDP